MAAKEAWVGLFIERRGESYWLGKVVDGVVAVEEMDRESGTYRFKSIGKGI